MSDMGGTYQGFQNWFGSECTGMYWMKMRCTESIVCGLCYSLRQLLMQMNPSNKIMRSVDWSELAVCSARRCGHILSMSFLLLAKSLRLTPQNQAMPSQIFLYVILTLQFTIVFEKDLYDLYQSKIDPGLIHVRLVHLVLVPCSVHQYLSKKELVHQYGPTF